MTAWMLAAACFLDRVLGDPPRLPHPVRLMGWGALALERLLRPRRRGAMAELVAGGVLTFLVVVGTYALTAGVLRLGYALHPLLGWGLEAWLIATSLALKGLGDAGLAVAVALEAGDLSAARQAVSHLVARETRHLPAAEVSRAAVESVAENTSDAFVAPLLYAALGGAPLALAYKAVNTLDSLYGYRDERNQFFGRAAARLDDVINWLPARLTAFFLAAAAWASGCSGRGALATVRADARRHPSPNAGYPEAAMAGALGVELGGENVYGGVRSVRPRLGKGGRRPTAADIRAAVKLMDRAGLLAAVVAWGGRLLWDAGWIRMVWMRIV